MERRTFLHQFGSLLLFAQHASAQNEVWQERESLALGDGLSLRIRQAPSPGPVFFVPHNDENVAVQAVEQLWRTGQPLGTLIELQQFDQSGHNLELRYIYQILQGKRIYGDPNRIYTEDLGIIEKRLDLPGSENRRCGVDFTTHPGALGEKAARQFQTVGDKITGVLRAYLSKTDPLIIALHNNTNSALQYSEAYFPRRQFELSQQRAVGSQSYQRDLDNFFLTTQREDYVRLSKLEWNTILQLPSALDDGSLSIWAAKQHIRYINIEAEHILCARPSLRHVAVQVQMLRAVLS